MKRKAAAVLVAMATCPPLHAQLAMEDSKTRVQLQNIGAYVAWGRNFTGKGVIVALLDAGIDPTHVDLNNGKILAMKRFYDPTKPISETLNGHGTAMASIIAGNLNNEGTVGVAYDARIVFAQIGSGTFASTTLAGPAAQWAADQGAVAANMSFAANFDSTYRSTLVASTQEKGVWIQTNPRRATGDGAYYGYANLLPSYKAATDKGIILVMAAGNQNLPYAAAPGMLATATDSSGNLLLSGRTIIVGGITSTLTQQLGLNRAGHICNSVSATGECRDLYRVKDFFVVAPGTATAAAALTGTGTQVVSGTSVATAYVTGMIAVLRQAWPQLRPEQTVQLIFRTARDLGAPGVDEQFGWGLVDFDKATRPFGDLVANVTAAGPKALTNTTTVSGTLVAQTVGFLNGSQFEDQFGRNYSVHLGDAAISSRKTSRQHPFLGLDGSLVQSFTAGNVTAMRSRDGFAYNVATKNLDVEFGMSWAREQVLGTEMRGYLGVLGSNNTWIAVGKSIAFDDWAIAAKAYAGHTTVHNSMQSAMRFSELASVSAAAQISKANFATRGDVLTLAARPINRVVAGNVVVSRVSDYLFEPVDGGYFNATPILETQRFALRSFQSAQYAVNYSLPLGARSRILVNYAFTPSRLTSGTNLVASYNVLF